MSKFLDLSGLDYFWSKLKALLDGKADSEHNHSTANITSGTLPIARGGTGAASAANARTNLGITPANIGAVATTGNETIAGMKTFASGIEIGSESEGPTAKLIPDALGNIEYTSSYSNATFTNLPEPINDTDVANKNYVDGIQSALASQIGGKQATITGAASSITSSNLTASRALVSDASGKVAVANVTATELGYLDGVTSAIQTQLSGKAASSHNHSAANITSGTLPIARGGTGATSAANARTNLGITEGTWTPAVSGVSAYTSRSGRYIKIGNTVTALFQIRISKANTEAASGTTITISGLPYTVSKEIAGGGVCAAGGLTGGEGFNGYFAASGGTSFGPRMTNSAGTITSFNFGTGAAAILAGAITYYTA